MAKEGGISGINRWAFKYFTFLQIFTFFKKDTGPLNINKLNQEASGVTESHRGAPFSVIRHNSRCTVLSVY